MSRHATWRAGFVWVVAAACSSTDNSHPPGILDDCSENCDKGYGSPSAGGGPRPAPDAGSETDSGTSTVECGSDCQTDPNFGLSFCSRSLVCPGVVVDRATPSLQFCGFIHLKGGCSVVDVECLCGAFLCPISTNASCATLPGLLSQQTDYCSSQIAANACRPLNTTANRDAGRCDPDCIRSCGNAPACIGLCC